MMRITSLALVVVVVVLSGCSGSASIVTTSNEVGGIQEGARWGIVKYFNQGPAFVVNARKADARKKMEAYCAPLPYRVLAVKEVPTGSIPPADQRAWRRIEDTPVGSHVYLKFECGEQ